MICKECGKEANGNVVDNVFFCPFCGSQYRLDDVNSESSSTKDVKNQTPEKSNKKILYFIIIAVLVFSVIKLISYSTKNKDTFDFTDYLVTSNDEISVAIMADDRDSVDDDIIFRGAFVPKRDIHIVNIEISAYDENNNVVGESEVELLGRMGAGRKYEFTQAESFNQNENVDHFKIKRIRTL